MQLKMQSWEFFWIGENDIQCRDPIDENDEHTKKANKNFNENSKINNTLSFRNL